MDRALEVIGAAEEELNNLCQGKRKFTMCVPVQDDDTDIVIGNALYIGRRLHGEVERLKKLMEAAVDCYFNERRPELMSGAMYALREEVEP
jgi:hypothetical protein